MSRMRSDEKGVFWNIFVWMENSGKRLSACLIYLCVSLFFFIFLSLFHPCFLFYPPFSLASFLSLVIVPFVYFLLFWMLHSFLSLFPSILDIGLNVLIIWSLVSTGVCSPKTSPLRWEWNSHWWVLSPTCPPTCCIRWWQVASAILRICVLH
jgi:hypothetical protein